MHEEGGGCMKRAAGEGRLMALLNYDVNKEVE